MLLMLKDTPVLYMDSEKTVCRVYQEQLLPWYLKGYITTLSDVTNENARQVYNDFYRYFIRFQEFMASRVLPLSRANAKKIYNLFGGDQSQTLENKVRISTMCRCVSLLDDYWVKSYEDKITKWSDVSIRDNPLNEVITQVALRGSSLSLSGSLCSPEIATDGAYVKGWKRENGKLWLYKKGYESKIEVMVSKLLDNMNINHVQYEDASDNGDYCSKCQCMTTSKLSIVDAGTLEGYLNRTGKSFLLFVKEKYADDLYKMWIVDYLISNSDRHSRNWGFYFDTDFTTIQGLHPLFDHNNAFDTDLMYDADVPYIANSNMTMHEAALYASKRVAVHYDREFTRDDFLTDRQYDSFMKRIKELNIQKDEKTKRDAH